MSPFETEIRETAGWMASPRFQAITRLYSARQVVEQRGTIHNEYVVARDAAEGFYDRLRELFDQHRSITTFGPYTPGQVTSMKRMGIEGIYLGGWATSAKGSVNEDPGSDLASYPLSQVPDEAAVLVRALLAADKNQQFVRSRMSDEERAATKAHDYRPFIIADADTGHGGDAHVRNLIRRFVEVGVPGYHIEDQKPGVKKCGHQGGKVLVGSDEQIKRLNAARFQLDIMGVAGIIVARTDAESASLLDGGSDERDQPFILGATNASVPSYKMAFLAMVKALSDAGVTELNGYKLYAVSEQDSVEATEWLESSGAMTAIRSAAAAYMAGTETSADNTLDAASDAFLEAWEAAAGLSTYPQAVAEAMRVRLDDGDNLEMSVDEWLAFAGGVGHSEAKHRALSMGIDIDWDPELAKTPEGYLQITGGIPYAVAKSLAAAPYSDLLWMETKTANLPDAKEFAEAIHAVYPEQMLAYNLSPSFNWDTTGMSEDEMRNFPEEIGKLGFTFNFITYGGHQVDGMASEEFATALLEDGALALARVQRKLRLTESEFRTPQSLVGGPRLDAALIASAGRTATTKAMGAGSTQFQHLVQTEVPKSLLAGWLVEWAGHNSIADAPRVSLRPNTAGSDLLELSLIDSSDRLLASMVFATIQDRRGHSILSIRDQHTADDMRRKRLMTLMHIFLIHRYKSVTVHYVSPTDDNHRQTESMKALGMFSDVKDEVGDIIVATVDAGCMTELIDESTGALSRMIDKS